MPWNYGYSASFYDIEVLKYAQGHLVQKSFVLDANKITMNADATQRTVVPAGTILERSDVNSKQVMPYAGTDSSKIVGILSRSAEVIASATNADVPVAVYFHNAIFATAAIVGYTNSSYRTALASALPTCKFE